MSVNRLLHLRRRMFTTCYAYYVLDNPIMSDDEWQAEANELKLLQEKLGYKHNYHDEQFKDWNGDTGMHLKPPNIAKSSARFYAGYRMF